VAKHRASRWTAQTYILIHTHKSAYKPKTIHKFVSAAAHMHLANLSANAIAIRHTAIFTQRATIQYKKKQAAANTTTTTDVPAKMQGCSSAPPTRAHGDSQAVLRTYLVIRKFAFGAWGVIGGLGQVRLKDVKDGVVLGVHAALTAHVVEFVDRPIHLLRFHTRLAARLVCYRLGVHSDGCHKGEGQQHNRDAHRLQRKGYLCCGSQFVNLFGANHCDTALTVISGPFQPKTTCNHQNFEVQNPQPWRTMAMGHRSSSHIMQTARAR
jgi:hypothetical protein